jgi:hypothetical protein
VTEKMPRMFLCQGCGYSDFVGQHQCEAPGPVTPHPDEQLIAAVLEALAWPTSADDCTDVDRDPTMGAFLSERYRDAAREVIAAVRPLIEEPHLRLHAELIVKCEEAVKKACLETAEAVAAEANANAARAVEAARAGERTRIADAIEAARLDPRLHGIPGGRAADDWLSGVHEGLRRAALIARGDTQ